MTKRMATILISLIMLAISFTLLLVFFSFNQNYNNSLQKLYISANNLSLNVGDTVENFYEINNKQADVNFEIDNEKIILINDDTITAIKVGKVNLTIIATYKENIVQKTILVDVKSKNINLKITPVLNCFIMNNNLYQTDKICQFGLEIINTDGSLICEYEYSVENAILIKEFTYFQLENETNCTITFYLPQYKQILYLNVITQFVV